MGKPGYMEEGDCLLRACLWDASDLNMLNSSPS